MSLLQLFRLVTIGVSGLAGIWLLLSLLWAPAYIVTTTPYPVDQDPASRDLFFEDIRISSEDLLLEGWWIPAEQPAAELIFVHGAGSNRISQYIGSLDFYRTLHELNISIVTMDIRNHGNSPQTDGILRMGSGEWPDVIAAARWLDQHHPNNLPRIVLGASMGGSTVIHAVHHGLEADGIILLDPQLDIRDSLMRGGQVTTLLPAGLFSVAVSAAIHQYDLPSGSRSPLVMGQKIALPILLIQDWDDPVTRSPYAATLAATNPNVSLAKVPAVDLSASCLEGKRAWGSHVAAHPCHPDWTRATVSQFLELFVD
ncbi:MAG: alpha/beta fold hydrolase [Luminiphilus sp.]|jgi:uncharacterized protein|nr:alpha/beta fold hydrolase [Luminiphilus sp.]